MISDKNEAEEEVDYADILETYFERIDALITVGVPIISVALPLMPNIVKFGKKRMGRYQSYTVTSLSVKGDVIRVKNDFRVQS
jgi:hypothetical protein